MIVPQSLFVTAMVAGVVQLVKYVRAKNWDSVVTIISAVLIGALAGVFHIEDLTVVSGLLAGLAAAGIFAGLEAIGGK